MPIEPKGTSPSSSLRSESRSQSSEPMPMPMQKSGEEERDHVLARVQHVLGVARQQRQDRGAEEPEPRGAEDGEEHGAVAARQRVGLERRPDRIPRECERGILGRQMRGSSRLVSVAGDGDADHRRR